MCAYICLCAHRGCMCVCVGHTYAHTRTHVCMEVTPVHMCVHVCIWRSHLCACVCMCVWRLHLAHTCPRVYMCVGVGPSTGVTPALVPLIPWECPHVCCCHCREKLSHDRAEQSQREHKVPALAPINFPCIPGPRRLQDIHRLPEL